MAFLYEAYKPNQSKYIYTCDECDRSIGAETRYYCTNCEVCPIRISRRRMQ